MARPNYTVVLKDNKYQVVPIETVAFKVKGTSLHKATLIKEELENA